MTTAAQPRIAHARQIDTEVARLYEAYYIIRDEQERIAKLAADNRKRAGLAVVATAAARFTRAADELDAMWQGMNDDVTAALAAARDFNEANYDGWQRFFLVGHLHRSTSCSSFRPTTRVAWLPEVSGLTEAEAVAEHGTALCTICFPSAPVALTRTQVSDDTCSGVADPSKPSRRGFYRGNWATCSDCGERVAITSTGKLRKHKR